MKSRMEIDIIPLHCLTMFEMLECWLSSVKGGTRMWFIEAQDVCVLMMHI